MHQIRGKTHKGKDIDNIINEVWCKCLVLFVRFANILITMLVYGFIVVKCMACTSEGISSNNI